jgi:hypothetical protein
MAGLTQQVVPFMGAGHIPLVLFWIFALAALFRRMDLTVVGRVADRDHHAADSWPNNLVAFATTC